LGAGYHVVPLLFGESALDGLSRDVVAQQAVYETGVEVVACTDGAYGVCLDDGILLFQSAIGARSSTGSAQLVYMNFFV